MFEMFVGSRFRFMEKRRVAYMVSVALILISIGSLVMRGGPRESIDFTGGNLLYVQFDIPANVTEVRSAAQAAGLTGANVQMAEQNTEAIIHFAAAEADSGSAFSAFRTALDTEAEGLTAEQITLLSQETVGPKIGKELERKAALAILWSLLLILVYIAWRFTRLSFGLGAVAALFHDILITLGLFSILNIEVSLVVVAAFLTIGGYSINDTIVVYDRIRENLGQARRMSFQEIINKSINQTLSRTVLTSGTTMLAVMALFFLGGPIIHDFALAMIVGVLIGTYSSIFVASSLSLDISNWWSARKGKAEGASKKPRAKAKAKAKAVSAS